MKQRILELTWQHNTEGAFLGPEETFSVMVRGVFQVQERANNERISDLFFFNSTSEETISSWSLIPHSCSQILKLEVLLEQASMQL